MMHQEERHIHGSTILVNFKEGRQHHVHDHVIAEEV